MIKNITFIVPLLILSCNSSHAFVTSLHSSQGRSLGLFATPSSDAISTLDASQKMSVSSIISAIPELAHKPDLSWNDGAAQIANFPATLAAYDAPGKGNVAWMCDLCVSSTVSSLTIFNGPLTTVPHLLSRCCVLNNGNDLSFDLDLRPRAYGAYEMVDAAGNYPGPETLGRQAFEYSGARKDFQSNFYTDEFESFVQNTLASLQGATMNTGMDGLSETEQLTRGPLAVSVTMPLTVGNVAAVAAARERAASYWLGWALDVDAHGHRPGAPVNTQYVYDTKFKLNAYGALLNTYNTILGPNDGATLAAAESGPLDEGYVGGGS
uniref:Uncharacterized protein n=1 Tax=Eucampia antarctica TaxID=49252 RepID=A0A7S2R3Z5_9STRA|mmetsp:Transcript_1618/g.1544  ORF Transcript_1618/g.1544 Transcript_1618/m.1544 type:complete len:323 (+) Transcript_1618:37-1005(+)|eukprot:CAMPEP_0197834778 /NCGR_PEP_ID=MMETSP1437-20131217/23696_1 /TAXON_ID=49252 ORGANISM="Eucampia antarctica, Strain CCMP1452" /NCGR_SAMPLE_ID=MMETSP1437 /ASSEMBLY_ACC=CAM_ASM_001096 /LENGTH=322 /DNA_ID=CAMNT_0043439737 /DNA_START=25 /DNA_END=993 /DNA_ORIENTATION=+